MDSNTNEMCYNHATTTALNGIDVAPLTVDAGEHIKTLDTANHIWNWLIENNTDRDAIIVCLGGGVICDLGGYVASCYKRGISSAYIPTSNLAMTDAAIGGKTGVNFAHIKNQIGTIHLPEAVLIDHDYLNTLPANHLISGWAETVKHALIGDKSLWDRIQNDEDPWSKPENIRASINVKLRHIEHDFQDKGIRQALNFGHTIGHAIEAVGQNLETSLLHGECIFIGMLAESWLATNLGLLESHEFEVIERYLSRYIKDIRAFEYDAHTLIHAMQKDKKNTDGHIVFTLVNGIGSCKIGLQPEMSAIEEALTYVNDYISK